MNRFFRMRRYNSKDKLWDNIYPQTLTENVLRRDNSGVLEHYLCEYDDHLYDYMRHMAHATSTGTHRKLQVNIKNTRLVDGFSMFLTLHTELDAEPSISFNGGEYKPIISGMGERVPGGQDKGAIILIVWSEAKDAWILMSVDTYTDVTKVEIPTVSMYAHRAIEDGEKTFVIPGFDRTKSILTVNYNQTSLRADIDYRYVFNRNDTIELTTFSLIKDEIIYFRITTYETVAKQSNVTYKLEEHNYHLVAEKDDTTYFDLPPEVKRPNFIEFNYGQTILRNGIDYELNNDITRVTFIDIKIPKGDMVTARCIGLVETAAVVNPLRQESLGYYRYNVKVLEVSYTAEEDSENLIPVTGFKKDRDNIVVIKDNHVLIQDLDYRIDELSQVVLSDEYALDAGEMIHFTIFQGAISDVPPFITATDSGTSGQHLLVDFSYDILRTGFTMVLRLTNRLISLPTIKTENGPAEPIVDPYGIPITGGFIPGSFLWVVYNEDQHVWYSMSHGRYDISESYPAYEMAEGDANFLGSEITYNDPNADPDHIGELIIPHGLKLVPQSIDIRPTEHPGKYINPYPVPEAGLSINSRGDSVKWLQWCLWHLKFAPLGVSLAKYCSGQYDENLEDTVIHWQKVNNLEPDGIITTVDKDTLLKQIDTLHYIIGDVWSSADETNIYVGNTGNATSKFHWVATTSNQYIDFDRSIKDAVDMLKARPGNFFTRVLTYTATEEDEYNIPIADFAPKTEVVHLVNFGQTILNEGEDFTVTDTGISLVSIRLDPGDVIQFTLVIQADD